MSHRKKRGEISVVPCYAGAIVAFHVLAEELNLVVFYIVAALVVSVVTLVLALVNGMGIVTSLLLAWLLGSVTIGLLAICVALTTPRRRRQEQHEQAWREQRDPGLS